MGVHESGEMYLETILILSQRLEHVRSLDVAEHMGFSKPSVHHMLRSLAELGVIEQEVFGVAFFTKEGRALAQRYAVSYGKLEEKMTEIVGSGWASENAICGLLADMPVQKLNELYD